MNSSELTRLESLLQKGINHEEEFFLPYYKTSIKIRPLSKFEINMCTAMALDEITDPDTELYFFMRSDERKDFKKRIKMKEYIRAQNMLNLYIVYESLKKIYPKLSKETVSRINGLEEIASRIMDISSAKEDDVEFFRGDAEGSSAKDVGNRSRTKISVKTL
ncbi:MAG: hypothetical protein ACTSRA_00375 [Promethearchaeota archaeon]|nr:MAG: hypothetical protein [Helarchaeota virus Nidhogg Meg22_1012]URC17410.1 MAG: hypothetical protein [Helarchaeota virus Nidhogg Meg22_1214]